MMPPDTQKSFSSEYVGRPAHFLAAETDLAAHIVINLLMDGLIYFYNYTVITAKQSIVSFTVLQKCCFMLYSSFSTFKTDVESHVVVGLISNELDPHSWTLTDYPLKWNLSPPTRVEQHHRAGVQSAPQHQPAGTERVCTCDVGRL